MRATCEGSGKEPLPSVLEDLTTHGDDWEPFRKTDDGGTVYWTESSQHICTTCRKPKRLLKSGVMPKHTRHVPWQEQQERRTNQDERTN
jgi:hypothetical protein